MSHIALKKELINFNEISAYSLLSVRFFLVAFTSQFFGKNAAPPDNELRNGESMVTNIFL